MFFIFYEPLLYYFHQKGKIILFDNPQEAMDFAQRFIKYSIMRASKEGINPLEVMQAQNGIKILSTNDFLFKGITCGTINFRDIR